MVKRKRDVPLLFWVSKHEKELIEEKMAQLGTDNLSVYLRKMAINGLAVKLELREMISLLRYSGNNLNQLPATPMRRAASMTLI